VRSNGRPTQGSAGGGVDGRLADIGRSNEIRQRAQGTGRRPFKVITLDNTNSFILLIDQSDL
jgi:hypothetical protein